MLLIKKKYTLLDNFFLPMHAAPLPASLFLLIQAVSAVIPAANLLATASFIDTSIAILQGNLPLSSIAVPLLFLLAVAGYAFLRGPVEGFIRARFLIQLRQCMRLACMEKQARLQFSHIESQDDWDLIERVTKKMEEKLEKQYEQLLSLAATVLSTFSIFYILMTQVWWAAIVVLAACIPLLYISYKGGEKNYEAERETTKLRRRFEYLEKVLTDRDHVAERGLFGFSEKVMDDYEIHYEQARKINFQVQAKWFIRSKVGGVLSMLMTSFVALALIGPVVSGAVAVGVYISLVNAISALAQKLSWWLSDYMDSLAKAKEYMKDLTAYMALSEEPGGELPPAANAPAFKSLVFQNVSFRYPGTEKWILNDLSFLLEQGKHYSFVGINGAGKTTLTKLITGLYRDYEGKILLNGKDLRGYSLPELKGIFCGVFQDYARYWISVGENIAIGSYRKGNQNDSRIREAIAISGFEPALQKLSNGLDTPLGKLEESGMDLSGGEWQRLAMARAIVNRAEVKILDEPTAALDPIGESEVYERFQQISNGHTTIFISHRLGSTQLADTIFVINGGTIAESGSHKELMERNGLYAEMFESQRSWYQ